MAPEKNLLVSGVFDRQSFKEFSSQLSAYANLYWLDELSMPELDKLLPSVDCLLVGFWPSVLDRERMSKMKRLSFVQVESAGVDRIPFKLLKDEVIVCSNSGSLSPYVAEHAWALILSAAKKVVKLDGELKKGEFEKLHASGFAKAMQDLSSELPVLKGRTLGIIGYGSIGRIVAQIGRAFGMKICAFGRSGAEDAVMYQGKDGLSKMLKISDVVVSTIPLTKFTLNLIGKKELAVMKKDAIFVNVSRGDIVDEEAIYDHLSRNPRFTFATDVWWYHDGREVYSSKLLTLANFIGTPHVAGIGGIRAAAPSGPAIGNVLLFLKGGAPLNVIKRSDYV